MSKKKKDNTNTAAISKYVYDEETTHTHQILEIHTSCFSDIKEIMIEEGEDKKIALTLSNFKAIDTEKLNKDLHKDQNQKVVDMAFCAKSTDSASKRTVLCEMKYHMKTKNKLKEELKDCAKKIQSTKSMLGYNPQFLNYTYFLINNSAVLRRMISQRAEQYGAEKIKIWTSQMLKDEFFC